MRTAVIILFGVVSLAPIGAALVYAGLYGVELTGLLARGFTTEHWVRVLGSETWWASLAYSAWIAGAVMILGALLAIGVVATVGPGLDRGLAARGAFVPMAVPPVVAALIVFTCFGATGWINRWLLTIGLLPSLHGAPSLVHDRVGAGVIVAHLYAATAFLALTFRSVHVTERVDELAAVAATLGAGARSRLVRVAAPLYITRSAGPLALVFVLTLGSYEIPLLLGQQSPPLLSVLVMRKFGRFDLTDKPEAMVMAVLYALAIGALVFLVAHLQPRFAEAGRRARGDRT